MAFHVLTLAHFIFLPWNTQLLDHTVPFSSTSGWLSVNPDWLSKPFIFSERSCRWISVRSWHKYSLLSAPSLPLSIRTANNLIPVSIFSNSLLPIVSRHRNLSWFSCSLDSLLETSSKAAFHWIELMFYTDSNQWQGLLNFCFHFRL